MSEFKISIITVCFNAAKTIERTINSVLSQSYPAIEYIIVDGASTDGTIEIIKKYTSKISKSISEKDNGIYDAMNKGIALATGDIVYFLNADDRFCDENVLTDIVKVFQEDGSRMLVYGNVRAEDVPSEIAPKLKKMSQIKDIHEFLHFGICHQSVFAKRTLFSNIGDFNCRYKYAADYEWLIRAFKYCPSGFFYFDRDIACYYFLGLSFKQSSICREEYAWIGI
jgi:glycosyltransferase involved in cell wall biosynthesis